MLGAVVRTLFVSLGRLANQQDASVGWPAAASWAGVNGSVLPAAGRTGRQLRMLIAAE